MGINEMHQIAELITRVINNLKNEDEIAKVKQDVMNLCEKFPLYKERRQA
jgi:glycine hydroxymethyltransferase